MNRSKWILLLNENEFFRRTAEDYCATLFDISCVVRSQRSTENLPKEVSDTLERNQLDQV